MLLIGGKLLRVENISAVTRNLFTDQANALMVDGTWLEIHETFATVVDAVLEEARRAD